MNHIMKTANNKYIKYILLESGLICLHYDVRIIVVCLIITNLHILFMCKQKQNGHREKHKCFLYRVIWIITSNYPNNYYTSMFNDIYAIHNTPCLQYFED